MARVDPFIIPLPRKLALDPEIGPFFAYMIRFLHDLWKRTGAGEDLVGDAVTAGQLTTALAVHTASNDNTTQAELDSAFTVHLAAGNPHPVYTTDVEVAALIATHTASVDNVTGAELTAAVSAHEGAGDPHPGYTTAAELSSALSALNLASGTYTPTLTNVTNVAASTAYACQYLRVGSVVNVSGRVDIDCTAGAPTFTQLGISLPIASNFADDYQCCGTIGRTDANTQAVGGIVGDDTNNRAEVNFAALDTGNNSYFFVFQYVVI